MSQPSFPGPWNNPKPEALGQKLKRIEGERDSALRRICELESERDELAERARLMRRDMLLCAEKLEMLGNEEPREVARVLRGEA